MTNQFKLTAPVALLVFNRPEHTARIFEAVRKAQPSTLLIVADGPRSGKTGEAELCERTRTVVENIDWPCKVLKNYSVDNLGCRNRVSSGLKWVFEQVEEAIILEDDCLPDPTFFQFCQDLLEKYRYDTSIGHISGNNFIPGGYQRHPSSYYFSRYAHIWGWASWRRALTHYDPAMTMWPELRRAGWLEDIFSEDPALVAYWRKLFNLVHNREIDTWDYQLVFSHWMQDFKSICPSKNLVSNIGFGPEATHTHHASDVENLPVYPMKFPLTEPKTKNIDSITDEFVLARVFKAPFFKPSFRSELVYRYHQASSEWLDTFEVGGFQDKLVSLAMTTLNKTEPAVAYKLLQNYVADGKVAKDIYYARALCCILLNDTDGARVNLELELNNYPDNQAARQLYAEVSHA